MAYCRNPSREGESARRSQRCIPPSAALSSIGFAPFAIHKRISPRFPARISRKVLHDTPIDSRVCIPAAAFRTLSHTRKIQTPSSHSPPNTRTFSTLSRRNTGVSRVDGKDRRLPRDSTRASRGGGSQNVLDRVVCTFRKAFRWNGSARSKSTKQRVGFPTCFPQFSSFPHGWSQQTTWFFSEHRTRSVSCPPAQRISTSSAQGGHGSPSWQIAEHLWPHGSDFPQGSVQGGHFPAWHRCSWMCGWLQRDGLLQSCGQGGYSERR